MKCKLNFVAGPKGCGACMPCIYRRAALNTIRLDTERYGYDICNGDIDPHDTHHDSPNDLRACLSFLRSDPSADEISLMLVENGKMDMAQIASHASVVIRAMDEVRSLLRAKAIPAIRDVAGL